MRVRILVNDQLKHMSQQRRKVPKYLYKFTMNGIPVQITVNLKDGVDPYTLHVGGIDFKNAYSSSGGPNKNNSGQITAITSSSGWYSTKPRPPPADAVGSPYLPTGPALSSLSFPSHSDDAKNKTKKQRSLKRSKSTAADFALDITVPSGVRCRPFNALF